MSPFKKISFNPVVNGCPTMNQKNGERNFVIYRMASLFEFYGTTFHDAWAESHARAAKILKSSANSGTVQRKATRNSDGFNVWHMGVAGSPWNATIGHTLDDMKKNPPSGHPNIGDGAAKPF